MSSRGGCSEPLLATTSLLHAHIDDQLCLVYASVPGEVAEKHSWRPTLSRMLTVIISPAYYINQFPSDLNLELLKWRSHPGTMVEQVWEGCLWGCKKCSWGRRKCPSGQSVIRDRHHQPISSFLSWGRSSNAGGWLHRCHNHNLGFEPYFQAWKSNQSLVSICLIYTDGWDQGLIVCYLFLIVLALAAPCICFLPSGMISFLYIYI